MTARRVRTFTGILSSIHSREPDGHREHRAGGAAHDLFRVTAAAQRTQHKGGVDPFQAATFEEFKNVSESLFFEQRLAANDGNVKRTAEELGMQRSHLYKKLDRYGLR